jgi:hypothetical protein
MAALVTRGIEPKRLVAKGYGPDVPIRENATEENRQANRRAQFRILKKRPKDAKAPDVGDLGPAFAPSPILPKP